MKVIHMDGNPWKSRTEMADDLGVSIRTITRMVTRGELVRREGEKGPQYRFPDTSPLTPVSKDRTGQDRHVDPLESEPELTLSRKTGQGQDVPLDVQASSLVEMLASELALLREERNASQRQLERIVLENQRLRLENIKNKNDFKLKLVHIKGERDLYKRLYEERNSLSLWGKLKKALDSIFRLN